LSIRNLTDEKYLNVLQGKLANLGDDIQDEPINNEQMKMLKNISTCDFVEIRKLYKNSNSVELTPTLIFTSNHILKSFEKGESYKRRVDWLPMYGKPKKKERDFISRLTCDKALRYWVKLIVEGYMRLYQNQRFTDCEKVNKFNEIYHSENNTALLYIGDFEIKDFIGKRPPSIYEDYVTWCEENGLNSQSKKLFASTVKDVLNLTVRNKRINGKTARVYSEE
jgi:putative DNA primase/helicase